MKLRRYLILSLVLLGCASNPKWDAEIWVGSPKDGAIVRKQAKQMIKCTDPRFADFFATKGDYLVDLRAALLSCTQVNYELLKELEEK